MNTIRVEHSYLKQRAKARPPEFFREALELATFDGDYLCWPEDVFNALRSKYPVTDDGPTLLEMGANAAHATGKWAAAGFPKTPAGALEVRRVTCAGGILDGTEVPQCVHFLPEGLIRKCALCGCNGIKLTWATERCPAGKWEAVQPVSTTGAG